MNCVACENVRVSVEYFSEYSAYSVEYDLNIGTYPVLKMSKGATCLILGSVCLFYDFLTHNMSSFDRIE